MGHGEKGFYAFAFDVDGYGLSNILKAMFDPLLVVNLANNNDNKHNDSLENLDYFPNFCGSFVWSGYAADHILVLLESSTTKFLDQVTSIVL